MSTPPRDDDPDQPDDAARAQAHSSDAEGTEVGAGAPGPRHGTDAAWAEIVANYGDRHDLAPDDQPPATRGGVAPDDPDDSRSWHPAGTGRGETGTPRELRDPDESDLARGPEDRFVPPPPPPLPWVAPSRLIAWLGVLGVPVGVLVALMLRVDVPAWVGTVLMVWFVGGFAFLVARMRPDRDDPDDGAVV